MRERASYAEPYRIKVVEPILQRDKETRKAIMEQAGYNVFNIRAEDVYIDLLTDSGTTAMSDNQWAGLMLGDESYAGCKNFYNLEKAIKDILGYQYVVPVHQGRAAENILMQMLVQQGQTVLGNMHFDTTEGHIRLRKAAPVNLVIKEGLDPLSEHPFKGNIDIKRLEEEIAKHGAEAVPLILLTVTCNSNGGQPVSMANIRAASEVARRSGIPLFIDAARFAENCYFIQQREQGYAGKSIRDIAAEMFAYADGCTMSAKKDALVNIGGFIAIRENAEWYESAVQLQIFFEGFRTYGGLAGRDLEAMARGLYEGTTNSYLEDRIGQVAYLGEKLRAAEIPIQVPVGGHGVFVDAARFLPHLPQDQFPAQALVVELYLEAGIRAVELGSCAFGYRDPDTGVESHPAQEFMRLAIPRRVYTDRHMDVLVQALQNLFERREQIRGLKMIYGTGIMRHFTARFAPLP